MVREPQSRGFRSDTRTPYFADLTRYPLLTAEQERGLAEKVWASGDRRASERLVTANLRLVVKLAREYCRPGTELLELVQEGNLGLVVAVQHFDPTRGVKLATYASFWIRAYILKYLLGNARLVKIGTTNAQRRLFFGLAKTRNALEREGLAPDAHQVAARLGLDEHEVAEMMTRMATPEVALDRAREGGHTPLETLPAAGDGPETAFVKAETGALLADRIGRFTSELTPRDRTIFQRRWRCEQQATLKQVGDQFGVTRERVRQLEQRMLGRLRGHLRELVAA